MPDMPDLGDLLFDPDDDNFEPLDDDGDPSPDAPLFDPPAAV